MATEYLDNSGAKLTAPLTITKQTGTTITFSTDGKFVEKDIEITIEAQEANLRFKGGELSEQTAAIAPSTEIKFSSVGTSGLLVRPYASASVSDVRTRGTASGWVEFENNALIIPGESAPEWYGAVQYITGVTLTNGKEFDITVPNGNSTITFHFAVDNSGNVTIT